MGIPRFGGWIERNAKSAVRKHLTGRNSGLYIDGNGMLHKARGNIMKDDEKGTPDYDANMKYLEGLPTIDFWYKIFNEVARLIKVAYETLKPEDYLVFAVDGVAPIAKIAQQASRRVKSATPSHQLFDRNAITPGTEYMYELHLFLDYFFRTNTDFKCRVIYSPYLEPGEGEHKIMDLLRQESMVRLEGNHIIYGLDADLILLGLSLKLRRVVICREKLDEFVIIDFLKNVLKERSIDPWNFIIVMAFIGNDFLHKPPCCIDMNDMVNFLIESVSQYNLRLYRGNQLNWNDVYSLIYLLSQYEQKRLLEGSETLNFGQGKIMRFVNRNDLLKYSYDSNPEVFFKKFRIAWYNNELNPRSKDERLLNLMSKFKFNNESYVDEKISSMCQKYCIGLEWYHLYYRAGARAVSSDWYYCYYHVPLFTDVLGYLGKTHDVSGFRNNGSELMNIPQQLVSVIPYYSRKILPDELQKVYSIESPLIDMYPIKFDMDMNGKHAEHEGVPYIPMVDKSRVKQVVSSLTFTGEEVNRWVP